MTRQLAIAPPPHYQLAALARDLSFQDDARRLMELPDGLVEALHAAFDEEMFLDAQRIGEHVAQIVGLDDRTRKALTAAFSVLPAYEREIRNFESTLQQAIETSGGFSDLAPDQLSRLVARLATIGRPTKAQERQWKAESLSTAIGFPLKSFDLVTDLRPVFDVQRDTIEGFVAVTTAVVTTEDDDEFVTGLSEDDLKMLATKVEQALKKLEKAKEIATKQGYAVARIGRDA
jgi:hypothetical protein